ncbi:RuBisCO accumulation factor 1 [Pseudanabaena sp. PCC 6802]|uniref:RuBisCO accumulation factor 1 n=1 Tax=Pseudanabaena sp. PCC 6802 TaxID=118173 RepID=UPI00034ADEB0|nr:RuBisCO accumulation factor 1 [Pseudanabaena sp. PCC 6802]
MTESEELTQDLDTEALIGSLLRKEGTWVQWGKACQQLQKSGLNPQAIFEQTGFEPIHQNQLVVAAQVYEGLVTANAPGHVLEYFEPKGSDILYEFRILPQAERVDAAELVVRDKLDILTAKDIAKAMKEFAVLSKLPDGFSKHPGDAIAYQAWKSATNQKDPQEKARLISRGLKFAHSDSARATIEQLLSNLVAPTAKKAPRLPVFRLEADDELPRIIPVVGRLPLSAADLKAVPMVDEIEPFGMVQYSGDCAWLALPGWQVVRESEDGVAILCDTDTLKTASDQELPSSFPDKPEEIVVLIDRAQRAWQDDRYFLVEQDGVLKFQWFDRLPELPLLGCVVLVMRQKRVLDEEIGRDRWQFDE